MKSFIAITSISLGLLLSVQSCLTCTKCERIDLEAKCVKPNDTCYFTQDIAKSDPPPQIHRYYNGGDSLFTFYYGVMVGFDKIVQNFKDAGYSCSVYPTGNVSKAKRCNDVGEEDDEEYAKMRLYENWGYTCHEYKGH